MLHSKKILSLVFLTLSLREGAAMKIKILVVAMSFIFSGCTPALQSKPSEILQLAPNHGVVVGSLVINLRKEDANFPVALADKIWQAEIWRADEGFFTKDMPFKGRSLSLKSDGKEVRFVAAFEPGEYIVKYLTEQGFGPNAQVRLKAKFIVKEAVKTYVGRLVITIPSERGNFDELFLKRRPVDIVIEDAQDETLSALTKEYGSSLGDGIQKVLMTLK